MLNMQDLQQFFSATLNWTSVVMKTEAGSGAKCINLDGNMRTHVFKVVHSHCSDSCLFAFWVSLLLFCISAQFFNPAESFYEYFCLMFARPVSYNENKSSNKVHGA